MELLMATGTVTVSDQKNKEALDRYRAECAVADAYIAPRQANGTATKEDWLKFSEMIRKAAEKLIASYYD